MPDQTTPNPTNPKTNTDVQEDNMPATATPKTSKPAVKKTTVAKKENTVPAKTAKTPVVKTDAIVIEPRFEGHTDPRVVGKANGRTKDHLKLAIASEGAVRGGHLRAWIAEGNSAKDAAAALGVSVSRIRALVDGPTVKARYALRVNPTAVLKGMDEDELSALATLIADLLDA